MINFLKRTWCEINLNAINNNYNEIKKIINKDTKIMSIVKADAYGHGVKYISKELDKLGTDWFGVSNLEEALQLRDTGIKKPVLILGYTPPEHVASIVYNDFTQTVFSEEYALALSEEASNLNLSVKVHIKIDTGMSRLGFVYQDEEKDKQNFEDIKNTCNIKNFIIDGIFTHFSCADIPDDNFTEIQFNRFMNLAKKLEDSGIKFNLKHCCNSAAILRNKNMNLDMVRAGLILYGLYPAESLSNICSLKPVMEMKSIISMIKELDKDAKLSYGATYETKEKTRIATVPIGYADGYPRIMSNKAEVLVCKKKVKVRGRVCMDQMLIDVTDIKQAKVNDIVTIFGMDGDNIIPVEKISELAGTINYETVCLIGKRVPRIYLKDKNIIDASNYFER